MITASALPVFCLILLLPCKLVGAGLCSEGHICADQSECCDQGCCVTPTPPEAIANGVSSLPEKDAGERPTISIKPEWPYGTYSLVAAALAGALVGCAWRVWRAWTHLGRYLRVCSCVCACCVPRQRHSASDRDSAGSCYQPPRYSRCSSLYRMPPPYSEVASKPDLYPLVINSANDDKRVSRYLMVQYFTNYAVTRPPGSLSATSTAESLNSSCTCNTANEANTIIPPPYSFAGNYEESRGVARDKDGAVCSLFPLEPLRLPARPRPVTPAINRNTVIDMSPDDNFRPAFTSPVQDFPYKLDLEMTDYELGLEEASRPKLGPSPPTHRSLSNVEERMFDLRRLIVNAYPDVETTPCPSPPQPTSPTQGSSEFSPKKRVDMPQGSSEFNPKKRVDMPQGSSEFNPKKRADMPQGPSEFNPKRRTDIFKNVPVLCKASLYMSFSPDDGRHDRPSCSRLPSRSAPATPNSKFGPMRLEEYFDKCLGVDMDKF